MVSKRAFFVARLRKGFARLLNPLADLYEWLAMSWDYHKSRRRYTHGHPNVGKGWDQPQ